MGMCCDYHAGMLRETVSFTRDTLASQGDGGYAKTTAVISGAPTRAHVRALSGREVRAADRIDATTRLRVVVRYYAGLLESDAVVIRSKRHNIAFINNVEFGDRWLEIDVAGGVAV